MGNHTWDNRDIFEWIDDQPRIVRPANFSEEAPGQGTAIIKANGKELAIVNMQGRTFLPAIDCPFRKADELVDKLRSTDKMYSLLIFMQKQLPRKSQWAGIWMAEHRSL